MVRCSPNVIAVTQVMLLALATFAFAGSVVHRQRPISVNEVPTVPSLNISQYLGLWYQMYTDPFNAIFEPNPFCATAFYGLFPNGSVSVRNSDRSGGYNGTRDVVEGYAYQDDPKVAPGQLSVVFPFNPVPGPYWIIRLGPVIDDQYQYAVVSDDLRLSLFVLARNVDNFNRLYDAEIISWLKTQGYDGLLNNITRLPQGPECDYTLSSPLP